MVNKPRIWLDGKRIKVVPQCAGCGLILKDCEDPTKYGWEFVEVNPFGEEWGWLCQDCQEL